MLNAGQAHNGGLTGNNRVSLHLVTCKQRRRKQAGWHLGRPRGTHHKACQHARQPAFSLRDAVQEKKVLGTY